MSEENISVSEQHINRLKVISGYCCASKDISSLEYAIDAIEKLEKVKRIKEKLSAIHTENADNDNKLTFITPEYIEAMISEALEGVSE